MQQSLRLRQQQTLSMKQIQSLKILACTNQELDALLVQEYLENPLLDCSIDKQTDMFNSIEHIYEAGTTYHEHSRVWAEEDVGYRSDVRSRDNDALLRSVMSQLHREDYPDEAWTLISYLVNCLDEKGFFPFDPETIAAASGYPLSLIESCLSDLKQLEPVGIFSRDLSECLIRQLYAAGNRDEVLHDIIQNHMPDVLDGRISNLTRAYKISTAKVKEYFWLIGTLNPRPFMSVENEDVGYVVPDIIAAWHDGEWSVTLNDSWIGDYRYDSYYLSLMKTSKDPELKAYFRDKLLRARMLIDAVESRRTTLIRISETILKRQEEYFLVSGALKPMTLEDVAKDAGVHLSTVSRAIQGKYLQFRRPVLLKNLFNKASSGGLSADIVMRRIRHLIETEDRQKPLSDEAIAKNLQAEGLSIPRRTVAKYRLQMGIPDSRRRAEHTEQKHPPLPS